MIVIVLSVVVVVLIIAILASGESCAQPTCPDIRFDGVNSNILEIHPKSGRSYSEIDITNDRTGGYLSYLSNGTTKPLHDAPFKTSYNIVWVDGNLRRDAYGVSLDNTGKCAFRPLGRSPSDPTGVHIDKKSL